MRFVRLPVLFYWLRGRLGCNWYSQGERRNLRRIEIAARLAAWRNAGGSKLQVNDYDKN
jgi:hypothetical protein